MRALVGIPHISVGVHNFADDDQPRHAAKIECDGCPTVTFKRLTGPLNPHHVRKRFEREGWQIGRKAYCPACRNIKPRATTLDPVDAELAALAPAPALRVVAGTDHFSAGEAVGASAPGETMATPNATPRNLTVDERAKVRPLLDNHFDDKAGRYEPGWNDDRVASETNTPRASVAAFRDLAYAPLMHDPDLDHLAGALAMLERSTAALEAENKVRATELKKSVALWQDDQKRKLAADVDRIAETVREQIAAWIKRADEGVAALRISDAQARKDFEQAMRSRGLKI